MNFDAKIYYLTLFEIQGEPFDPDEFLKYISANRSEYFKLNLKFDPNHFNVEFFNGIKKLMDDYGKSCENTFVEIKFNP
uniref:Uncharacterized protein n=1 Tax=Panagrolaimus sp. ES5 TaxID=591445 RepID=A0AC34FAM3_9BILA